MPFLSTRPDSRTADTSANQSRVRPAGDVRQSARTGSLPGFHIWCTAPRGISSTSPGPSSRSVPSTRVRRLPSSTSKRSSWAGWKWAGGGLPPAPQVPSTSSASSLWLSTRTDSDGVRWKVSVIAAGWSLGRAAG